MNTDNTDPINPSVPLTTNPVCTGNKPPNGGGITSVFSPDKPDHDVPISVDNRQIKIRLICGYTLVVFSIFGVWQLLTNSLRAIELIQFTSPTPFTYDYVRLSVRGLVTLAGMFFCHRLIQVGERMVIPVTLLRNSEDLKLLLGGNKNPSMPLEYINEIAKLIKTAKD